MSGAPADRPPDSPPDTPAEPPSIRPRPEAAARDAATLAAYPAPAGGQVEALSIQAPAEPAPEPPVAPRAKPVAAKKRGGLFGGQLSRVIRGLGRTRRPEELRDTLQAIIDSADVQEEVLEADERRLLRNILRLHEVTAGDVMVPRAEIVAIDVKTSLPRVIELIQREAHSRYPVYRGALDDIVGMVHVKDVLPYWNQRRAFNLEGMLRKVLFTAPSMRVLDLLREMRNTRLHLALVVDEYGGMDGLVTIEDLVEEIVGEIEDEYDDKTAPVLTEESPGTVLADARVKIEEFERRFGAFIAEEESDEVDTLGGLVFYLADRVPVPGEIIRHPSGVEFEIVDADARRVRMLRVRNLPGAPTGSGARP